MFHVLCASLLLLLMFLKMLEFLCDLPSCRLAQREPGVHAPGHICYLHIEREREREKERERETKDLSEINTAYEYQTGV